MDITVVDAELPLRPAAMRRQYSPKDFFTTGSDSESKTSRSVEVDQESASTASKVSSRGDDADDEKFIHFQTSPRIARWREKEEPRSRSSSTSSERPRSRRSLPSVSTESDEERVAAPVESLDQRAQRLAAFAKLVKHSEFFDREDYELVHQAARKAAQERDEHVARLGKREQLMRILQERERFIEQAVIERRLLPSQDLLLFSSLVKKQVMLMQMLSEGAPQ